MTSSSTGSPELPGILQRATDELRRIENLLVSANEIDAGVLTDFRDAVNRVRTTAWGVQQYAQSKASETNPDAVLTVLAGERVRAVYVMCKQILADLDNANIQLQKGPLLRLHDATKELAGRLERVGER